MKTVVFLSIMSWLMLRAFSGRVGTAWAAIPGFFLGAIGLTRALQASSAARRLALLGFQPKEVVAGLRGTVDERESMRQQLRADADTRRRRRKTLITAAIMLPIAVVLIQLSLNIRWSIGSNVGVVTRPAEQSVKSTPGRVTAAATGLSLFGVAFLLLARSPFRMPVGERMFRLVWLGPLGEAFLKFSARGVEKRPTGTTIPGANGPPAVTRPPPPPVASSPRPAKPDRMASLEERVAALERWRNGA